jgi:hypothetical protein
MTVEDQITAEIRVARPLARLRARLREPARRALWRYAPAFARRRSLDGRVQRLESDFEHTRKRHTEQIERLEDLARELVKTAESLRRDIAEREHRSGR